MPWAGAWESPLWISAPVVYLGGLVDEFVDCNVESRKVEFLEGTIGFPWASIQFPDADLPVNETPDYFEGNALLKAIPYHSGSSMVVAEDSGLSIHSLGGFHEVKTARWVPVADADGAKLILERMEHTPDNQRTAALVSVIAVILPNGNPQTSSRQLNGKIAHEPAGDLVDGYVSIFRPEGGLTIRQMKETIEKPLLHRWMAIQQATQFIHEFFDASALLL